MSTALELLPAHLVGTTIQCLPALIVLVAWSEGGHRLIRQFGARMMWELAGPVAIGVAVLLYFTVQLAADDGANIAISIVMAASVVPVVTLVTHRVPVESPPVRFTLATTVSLVSLHVSAMLGILLYAVVWRPVA